MFTFDLYMKCFLECYALLSHAECRLVVVTPLKINEKKQFRVMFSNKLATKLRFLRCKQGETVAPAIPSRSRLQGQR